ncbi:hypothetical protein FACS1894105_11520 [Clostridia bacterium]|nr:hypothetical protein FACS1894105_11520 [Clostridia bacterium]
MKREEKDEAMSFSFQVNKPNNIKATLAAVKAEVENYPRGSLTGNEIRGYIVTTDGVEGEYVVSDSNVTITITKKPLSIIPNKLIENEVRKLWNVLAV